MNDTDSPHWLGYELHDGLLQWVIGARMQLEVALAATADPPQRKRLKRTMRFIELAIDEGRGLIGFIEEQGSTSPHDFAAMMQQFVRALQPLAEDRQQTLVFQPSDQPWPDLPPATLWNVLRVAQQAVRNAISHAGPATITITSDWLNEQRLQLQVHDTGVGFEQVPKPQTSATGTGHFGVSSMQHRASLINADLEIVSSPGQGCRVQLAFDVATQLTPPT